MTQFWNQSRGFIATGALVALVAVSGLVGYQTLSYRLPDPATTDRQGLLKWMVLRDMSEQPDEIQDRLVDRLEAELRSGVDLKRVNSEVSEEQKQRFWRNVDILLERWFRDRTMEFHRLSEEQRAEYVRTTVDDVLTWEFVRRKRSEYQAQGGDSVLLSRCEQNVSRWSENASPEAAEKYRRLVVYIKADLMLRSINGTL